EAVVGGEEEEEIDDRAHEKLLTSIYALSGKKRYTNVVRGLPSTSSSVDLIVHAKSKIRLEDLKMKPSKGKSQLKKPRTSLETEKAQRQIARDTMASEMSKWDPVVHEIRAAPQVIFSKRPHGIKMYEAVQPKAFTPRTALEKEIYEALGKSEDVLRPDQKLTVAEQRALKVMSVKEAKQRRAELLRHHELLSRMELKAKWQNKIKSKRYRKIVRKEKVMAEKKLLEELQKENPEAFLERLGQIERDRMEERLTLKHRGGGKFSRMHKAYSKFDDKTRESIQEMLQKSRELTKKQQEASSSEDESANVNTSEADRKIEDMNESDGEDDDDAKKTGARASQLEFLKAVNKKAGGWLDVHKTTFVYTQQASQAVADVHTDGANIDAHISGIASVGNGVSLEAETHGDDYTEKISVSADSEKDPSNEVTQTSKDTVDLVKHRPEHTHSQASSQDSEVSDIPLITSEEKKKKRRKRNPKKDQENPSNSSGASVSKEKPVEEVTLLVVSDKTKDDNSDEEMTVTMEELFQDEDVVEQFAREKAEAEEKSRPKLEDAKLPGWGSWAGPDYKSSRQNQKQKQKEKIKQPNVWLNPDRDAAMRKLQPKTVPFPYTSVQQYEASVRQPVSRGFVRETAFKLLTKPEVVTKLGHIIKPLDKDDYVKEREIEFDDEPKTSSSHKKRGQKRKSVK
ncbi:unnamed protein product, partial [Candidula unifasciata]